MGKGGVTLCQNSITTYWVPDFSLKIYIHGPDSVFDILEPVQYVGETRSQKINLLWKTPNSFYLYNRQIMSWTMYRLQIIYVH